MRLFNVAELRAALTQLRMPAAHLPPDGRPRRHADDDEDAVWALIVMLYLRGSEAVDELSREIDSRRASWAVGTLPRLLFLLARADATRDRWVRARSAYAESIELAHELGHIACGHVQDLPTYLTCRGRCEVEAESVAYVVAAAHGLDASGYTFAYVAGWAGTDLTCVRQAAETVTTAARTILAACSNAGTATAPDDLADAA